MRKQIGWWSVILLLMVFLANAAVWRWTNRLGESVPLKTVEVKLKGQTFTLEVADTEPARNRGLSGRDKMADDHGMLFVFDEPGPQSFWMKDCKFGLDLVFLDQREVVTSVLTMDVPKKGVANRDLPQYSSKGATAYAIELNAGVAGKIGLKEGDLVELPSTALKGTAGKDETK